MRPREHVLGNAEFMLQLFERDATGFGKDEKDKNKLNRHHGCEEGERGRRGAGGDAREVQGDQCSADPVGGAADGLALGADAVGKDLRDVDPDDRALRDGEEQDVDHQHPDEQALMRVGVEDLGDRGEGEHHADRADEQKRLAAELIDQRHAQEGGEEVDDADQNGLEAA